MDRRAQFGFILAAALMVMTRAQLQSLAARRAKVVLVVMFLYRGVTPGAVAPGDLCG